MIQGRRRKFRRSVATSKYVMYTLLTLLGQKTNTSIPAGKMVALVERSGCGKSTVNSLVKRLYDPSKGEILIDNRNIKDLDLKFLGKIIGSVSREPSLLSGTIKDNSKVGNMDANNQQAKESSSYRGEEADKCNGKRLDEAISAFDSNSKKLAQDALGEGGLLS
ncbi:hypothetical protein V6N13_089574 [Hibiscus sabdariffa]|uniref:ABC transporter domain-containing protein n=1 Tax=Hibiscus sabdariffa TaxID=183260 RepID=A0ABR2QJM1_9ROSI